MKPSDKKEEIMSDKIPVEISYNHYKIKVIAEGLPSLYERYCENAELAEDFKLDHDDSQLCYISVAERSGWPFLVIRQQYYPAGYGFHPGIFLIEENHLLFIGAGERLLCYDLFNRKRLWEDRADTGFWHWTRYNDFILMSAELEFACFDRTGQKLWSTFVEPPWDFSVNGSVIRLDVMGHFTEFDIKKGPVSLLQE